MKIDEQCHLFTRKPQIGQHDCFVNRAKSLNRFQFNNYAPLYQEIKRKSAVELDPLVDERHWFLFFESNAAKVKFVAKTLFVRGFEQARTKKFVHFYRRADDVSR